jgi:8-oxo-dGTP pyrophosphatase MutT (NUDIX family)
MSPSTATIARDQLTLVVACALIDADNRVLLAQRPKARRSRAVGIPGGKLEPGERPEPALIRELQKNSASRWKSRVSRR